MEPLAVMPTIADEAVLIGANHLRLLQNLQKRRTASRRRFLGDIIGRRDRKSVRPLAVLLALKAAARLRDRPLTEPLSGKRPPISACQY
jgi:hypothetical protein